MKHIYRYILAILLLNFLTFSCALNITGTGDINLSLINREATNENITSPMEYKVTIITPEDNKVIQELTVKGNEVRINKLPFEIIDIKVEAKTDSYIFTGNKRIKVNDKLLYVPIELEAQNIFGDISISINNRMPSRYKVYYDLYTSDNECIAYHRDIEAINDKNECLIKNLSGLIKYHVIVYVDNPRSNATAPETLKVQECIIDLSKGNGEVKGEVNINTNERLKGYIDIYGSKYSFDKFEITITNLSTNKIEHIGIWEDGYKYVIGGLSIGNYKVNIKSLSNRVTCDYNDVVTVDSKRNGRCDVTFVPLDYYLVDSVNGDDNYSGRDCYIDDPSGEQSRPKKTISNVLQNAKRKDVNMVITGDFTSENSILINKPQNINITGTANIANGNYDIIKTLVIDNPDAVVDVSRVKIETIDLRRGQLIISNGTHLTNLKISDGVPVVLINGSLINTEPVNLTLATYTEGKRIFQCRRFSEINKFKIDPTTGSGYELFADNGTLQKKKVNP